MSDEKNATTEQDAQEPIGGGECGSGMVRVPVGHNPFPSERLLKFERELTEINLADLAWFLRAPQG
jgi:hypothetical protein